MSQFDMSCSVSSIMQITYRALGAPALDDNVGLSSFSILFHQQVINIKKRQK